MIPIANPDLGDLEIEGVSGVIESGMVADGSEVREFESEFADYCGVDHAVATSNGTTALHAALEALDIGVGDRVVTTPFSFIASSNAIRLTGAEPVFVDIDPQTFNLDSDSVREIVQEQDIDAILAVHLFGLPCDMTELRHISRRFDIDLIEDCAQAHGAEYRGESVGTFGDVACFSFYPTKNMTTGEGGMVVTNNERIAAHAASFVNHGRAPAGGYEHVRLGHNFRMTNIAAAIGKVQLQKLPRYLNERRATANRYNTEIDSAAVDLPPVPDDRTHSYHQYTLRASTRDALLDYLQENGIGAKVYYPKCIHNQPAYADYEYDMLHAEQAAEQVVSIPVHPALSESDVTSIIETINDY